MNPKRFQPRASCVTGPGKRAPKRYRDGKNLYSLYELVPIGYRWRWLAPSERAGAEEILELLAEMTARRADRQKLWEKIARIAQKISASPWRISFEQYGVAVFDDEGNPREAE